MKYLGKSQPLLLTAWLVLLSACSPKITRVGYQKTDNSNSNECEIVIKENAKIDEAFGEVLASIKITDSGFSKKCSEEDVLEILRVEACVLGANLVNLREVKRPNLASTCFRCSADFIKLDAAVAPSSVESSSDYSDNDFKERVHKSKASRVLLYILGFAAGWGFAALVF